jgi:hypothetical protein
MVSPEFDVVVEVAAVVLLESITAALRGMTILKAEIPM